MIAAFLLWCAVIIGCILAFAFGGAEGRGIVVTLGVFAALGLAVQLIDGLKKHDHRRPPATSFDCLDGRHWACSDCACEHHTRPRRSRA